jgi:hypothetical protein
MGSAGGPCRANSQPGGSEGAASILHGGIMGMGRGLADPNLHRIAVRNPADRGLSGPVPHGLTRTIVATARRSVATTCESRYGFSRCFCLEAEKISHATMKIAAMSGPMTKPFRPNTSMPPNVEISTT